MKPSGVEWIGDIPQEWSKDKVFRVFSTIGSGTTPKSSDESKYEGNINWIQSGDINGGIITEVNNHLSIEAINKYSALRMYALPFIVIAMYGASIGNISISKIDSCVNQACCVLAEPKININYAFLSIKAAKNYLITKAVGGGQPNISQDIVKSLWLPIPPLPEQQRIAEFLDRKCAEIDSIIGKTKATIEEYKALKQAVITQAVTKGIRPDRPMKDSGDIWIGLIPEDVKLSRTGLHFNIVLGKMLCTDPIDDSYTYEYYYCAANVHFGELSNDGLKQMWFNEKERQQYSVNAGDLLVVEGGAGAGGCCLVPRQENKTYIQNSIMIVRGKNSNCTGYLRYLIEFLVKSGYVDVVCNKATIPHFTKEKLAAVPFPLFSPIEQQEIADYLDQKCAKIDRLIAAKEQLLTELESYKKSVIYEYVTGKKDV